MESLPESIREVLRKQFGSWTVQEPANLSQRARQRWEDEKPLACPGIAAGQYEHDKMRSYAVLLVPRSDAEAGFRFVIFSPSIGRRSYKGNVVDQWNEKVQQNFFIRNVPISKFFDEQSKKKFDLQNREGILFVDSAENEYEVEVYFWARSSYKHEPVDY